MKQKNGVPTTTQDVLSFRAVDIYGVQNGQISDNWHLEDNLSLMQQLGVVKP